MSLDELEEGIEVAIEYDVASVCILPFFVEDCAAMLAGTSVVPCTTIAFPHGCQATVVKIAETLQAVKDGAKELDMVINISRAISEDWYGVGEDIHSVVNIAHDNGAKVKVIFENALLNDQQKITLCELCGDLGVDWVKTSTGYGATGATPADVKLMREHSPENVQIKASGGIRGLDDLLKYRALGVTRVGASGTQKILDECKRRLGMD